MPDSLQAGDVIVQLKRNQANHCLMWVGGEKPIIHSADADNFSGVIQQSASFLPKLKDDLEKWTPHARVFRNQRDLGAQATKFAKQWAVRSDDEAFLNAMNLSDSQDAQQAAKYVAENPREKRQPETPKHVTVGNAKTKSITVVLDTPYSQDRLEQGNKEWDVYSLFRALRAYDRGTKSLPLSQLKGITCSQFITYCYQAASLDRVFGGCAIPQATLQHISDTGAFYSLKRGTPEQANLIEHGLHGYSTDFIPKAMLVDAKTTSAGNLMRKLLEEDSQFTNVGDLALRTNGKLVVVSNEESAKLLNYGDLKELLAKHSTL